MLHGFSLYLKEIYMKTKQYNIYTSTCYVFSYILLYSRSQRFSVCLVLVQGLQVWIQAGALPVRVPSQEREREREREREYVHQEGEGTATDPVETVLVKFFFLTFFGSH